MHVAFTEVQFRPSQYSTSFIASTELSIEAFLTLLKIEPNNVYASTVSPVFFMIMVYALSRVDSSLNYKTNSLSPGCSAIVCVKFCNCNLQVSVLKKKIKVDIICYE